MLAVGANRVIRVCQQIGVPMSVMVAEDRSMCVQPHQVVRTAWIDIDVCRLGFRSVMSPEAVEKKFRRLLNIGEAAPWPPIVGHWESGHFLVDDGRHDYLAALMLGRQKLFVCWLEGIEATTDQASSQAARPGESRRTVWPTLPAQAE